MKVLQLFFSAGAVAVAVAVLVGISGCATSSPKGAVPGNAVADRGGQRPGIATGVDGIVVSAVESAPFQRAGAKPDALGMFYYNDEPGVKAMLEYVGGHPVRTNGPQRAGAVSFGLRDAGGVWCPVWVSKGKSFAVGVRGRRFQVVLKNESSRPVEVVVSVDGLDVVDFGPASVDKRGYVLEARQEIVVDGFRVNDNLAAAFKFGAVKDSHVSNKYGDTRNCGVVGVAVFGQRDGIPASTGPQPRRPAPKAER